jgi:antitoxin YqcF
MAGSEKTQENLEIFHAILDIYGDQCGKCITRSYWDEIKQNWIDIVTYPNSPFEDVTSYATIGLSDFSIGKKVGDIQLGIEIVGACNKKFDKFPNIMSTCAFNIIVEHSSCFPGCIYPDLIDMYMPESSMKHILFMQPFGWNKEFHTLEFPTKKVAWLLTIPISEAEYQYARKKGAEALEIFFEKKQIDIYDLNRKSVL